MKRIAILAILLAGPLLAMGQSNQVMPGNGQNQQIITPPPSTQVYNGGYGYGGGGQTPEGAALQGMSQVISAAGQAHLANSAAAINWTQAQSNEMRNEVQGVQTFWAMRDIGKEEREKEQGPAPHARGACPPRPRRRAAAVEHEPNRSRDGRTALAQRFATAKFRPAARPSRRIRGEVGEVRHAGLRRSDPDAAEHRRHVRFSERPDHLDPAPRLHPMSELSAEPALRDHANHVLGIPWGRLPACLFPADWQSAPRLEVQDKS